jgi:two-component system, sensor histidine kinase PdtaS
MSFFNPDVSFTNNYYEKGIFKLAWRLTILSIIVFSVLSLIFVTIDILAFGIYLITLICSLTSLVYMYKTKKTKFVFWLCTVSASVMIILSINTIMHTLHYSDLIWMVCTILFAYIGLSYRVAIFFIAIHSISLICFVAFGVNEHFEVLRPRTNIELLAAGIEILFAFFVMAYFIHQNIRFQRYAEEELKTVNARLEIQNKENVTLLKEVHHRVKNNLQIVVSLLRIQSSEIKSDETKEHFLQAINRIMTISMIHKKLYELGELSRLEFEEYISGLIDEIKLLHLEDKNVDIQLSIDLDELDLKSVVPLGLIINELITNSMKHAFEDQEQGEINIQFKKSDNKQILFEYSDNGAWKQNSKLGFGEELLILLTEQLDGNFKRKESTVRIQFPPKKID